MLGPVFRLDVMLGARRGRQYIFRWLFAALLILETFGFWVAYYVQRDAGGAGKVGPAFVEWYLTQQFILMVLITPVFTAGAITDEKLRGTLQYLLTADLTPAEIVLGKLFGRLFQVMLLGLAGLPVLCVFAPFGGLSPAMMLAVLLATLGPLYAIGCASLLASVWVRQTRDAVLGLFTLGGLFFLAYWALRSFLPPGAPGTKPLALIAWILDCCDPRYVVAGARAAQGWRDLVGRMLTAWAVWGGLGTACLALAIFRLKPAYRAQLEGRRSRGAALVKRILPARPPVGRDPILWKVRFVEGIAPLSVLQDTPRWLAMFAIAAATLAVGGGILYVNLTGPPHQALDGLLTGDLLTWQQNLNDVGAAWGFLWLAVGVLLVASGVVGMRCSGSVSGEREKQSWEALLLAPIETRRLIRGKLWGVMGAVQRYFLVYAVCVLPLAFLGGMAALIFVAIGLVVTELAMFFMAGVGIWCSVKSRGSWRALVGTMSFGYGGGLLLFIVLTPVNLFIGAIVWMLLRSLEQRFGLNVVSRFGTFGQFYFYFFLMCCLTMACVFLGIPWFCIKAAESWVGAVERTRIWRRWEYEDERPRRRRRIADPRGLPANPRPRRQAEDDDIPVV